MWMVYLLYPVRRPSSKYFLKLSFLISYLSTSISLYVVGLFLLLLLFEFVTPALADGFLLEFEWQQVSSNLQDSSQ